MTQWKEFKGNRFNKVFDKVREVWPGCVDMRWAVDDWELAFHNSMGGKHWIKRSIAPYAVDYPLSYPDMK